MSGLILVISFPAWAGREFMGLQSFFLNHLPSSHCLFAPLLLPEWRLSASIMVSNQDVHQNPPRGGESRSHPGLPSQVIQ